MGFLYHFVGRLGRSFFSVAVAQNTAFPYKKHHTISINAGCYWETEYLIWISTSMLDLLCHRLLNSYLGIHLSDRRCVALTWTEIGWKWGYTGVIETYSLPALQRGFPGETDFMSSRGMVLDARRGVCVYNPPIPSGLPSSPLLPSPPLGLRLAGAGSSISMRKARSSERVKPGLEKEGRRSPPNPTLIFCPAGYQEKGNKARRGRRWALSGFTICTCELKSGGQWGSETANYGWPSHPLSLRRREGAAWGRWGIEKVNLKERERRK